MGSKPKLLLSAPAVALLLLTGCSDQTKPDLSASSLPLTTSICDLVEYSELKLVLELPKAEFVSKPTTPGDGSVVCDFSTTNPEANTVQTNELDEPLGRVRFSVLRSSSAPQAYDTIERSDTGARRLPGVGQKALVRITEDGVQLYAVQNYTYIVASAKRQDSGLLSEPLGALVSRLFDRIV